MAFVTIPNGVNQQNWWPQGLGTTFTVPPTMAPLADLKDKLQVISGLDHIHATAGADGPGDHARASATLLTGCRAKKTAGSDIYLGPSVDQIAAQHLGHFTRFPSLELTSETHRPSGSCDSGYACAYQFNVSWRSATTPLAAEHNPRKVFERLFGGGTAEERRRNVELRRETTRSIVDFVREDARSIETKLNSRDRLKLEEYLTSLREVEQQLSRVDQLQAQPPAEWQLPNESPEGFGDRLDVLFDLLVLAFQTDSTRFATLMLAHDGSNRSYPQVNVKEGHHELSHHQGDAGKLDKIARIDRFHIERFARFLHKLSATKEEDGRSILDNSMIVYAGGNADGNAHSHTNLPVILAGAGGGALHTGRFHKVRSMPMSNLYVEMLETLGIHNLKSFGDSNNLRVEI
ncbi:MAG: DUF1552 domain-containing protein [Pirellulales bacterium]|nr:DUF1552 domain-containing protein [Pirellulales bacterium]